MSSRVLVISANLGRYDKCLPLPPPSWKDVHVLGFVSGNTNRLLIQEDQYTTYQLSPSTSDYRTQSRILKLYPTPLFDPALTFPAAFSHDSDFLAAVREQTLSNAYTHVVWLDSNCKLRGCEKDFLSLVSQVHDGQWGIYSHPDRSCAYNEARCVKSLPYVNRYVLNAQMAYYRSQYFPKEYGLYSCNFIVRSMSAIHASSSLWYEWMVHFLRWSPRDQLSLPFLLFQNPLAAPRILGKFSWHTPSYTFVAH